MLLAAAVLLLASCSVPVGLGGGAAGGHGAAVTVTGVADGDTLYVSPEVDGRDTVRLIGVDSPETHASGGEPGEGAEPMGPEALAFTGAAVEGERVSFEPGAEEVDRYGRLLAYATPETGPFRGRMLEVELLERGLAQAYPYPPNTQYRDRFARAQEEARSAGRGVWGLPRGEQCELADRGNGIGEGSPGCLGASSRPDTGLYEASQASDGPGAGRQTGRTEPQRGTAWKTT